MWADVPFARLDFASGTAAVSVADAQLRAGRPRSVTQAFQPEHRSLDQPGKADVPVAAYFSLITDMVCSESPLFGPWVMSMFET